MMDRFAETEILLQDHCLRVRKLLESDGEILVKWLTDPAVLEFYEGRDQLFDLERVNRKFFARGDGVDRCIVEWKNHPIGYVQCYSVEKNKRLHPAFSDQDIIFGQLLHLLDKEFDCFDIKDSSNYGWHSNGHLVLIDYGMTKKLYEESWVPLAESGILPQIDFDHCQICGIKKELRMYGDSDTDKRCYECGKQ